MLDFGRHALPVSRLGVRLVSRACFSSSARGDNMSKWDLPKVDANYTQLSPLSWLKRSSRVYPDELSAIHGSKTFTWKETAERCGKLANALISAGVKPGDTVAAVASNTPEMNELHFGVSMAGAVLNAINTRLDPATIAFILDHGESSFLVTDTEFSPAVKEALKKVKEKRKITVIDIRDSEAEYLQADRRLGECDYEEFIQGSSPVCNTQFPLNEWDPISLNYTSGTTGDPKGVVTHHRGAYLNAMSNAQGWMLPPGVRYLWTLPMFHCNGWTFPWALAAVGGTSVCLRKVSAKGIYEGISKHRASHLCAAPIVLNTILDANASERMPFDHEVKVMTAAAPPTPAMLQEMQERGFEVTHVYGLTETYGPAVSCVWKPEWSLLPLPEQARLRARQGVNSLALEDLQVLDPETMQPVPADGKTTGELMFKGNLVMKGYLKNPEATQKDFKDGWFHSGDVGVMHPDGYVEVKDRSKDVIISGGENISSIEVEGAIASHPDVAVVCVVARPDKKWGERPSAYIELKEGKKEGVDVSEKDIIDHCRPLLAKFKMPSHVIFKNLPKTVTGKIQKFQLRAEATRAAELEDMEAAKKKEHSEADTSGWWQSIKCADTTPTMTGRNRAGSNRDPASACNESEEVGRPVSGGPGTVWKGHREKQQQQQ